jgi:hypothetical protein
MSEEEVTLDFLAHQIRGMRDDVLSLKEDMSVLTAIVLGLERDAARREARDEDMLTQMRAMVRQHQPFSELSRRRGRDPGVAEIWIIRRVSAFDT